MPVHDWTRVEAGIFHAFHTTWVGAVQSALNQGGLPEGYYALAEQHTGGVAVAEAPARVRWKQVVGPASLARRRTLAIRHSSGHRLVALLEIVSPANKDRAERVDDFATKAVSALERGVHLLLVDLIPPGPYDPRGMHGAILQSLDPWGEPYELPAGEPLTLAGYQAESPVNMWIEHPAVGAPLPEMPLFLRPDRYVNAPLEETYQTAYQGMPSFWRAVLEK